MKYELQFLILIQPQRMDRAVQDVIIDLCRSGRDDPDSDLNCEGNWLSVHLNDFYDPIRIQAEDGYCYYQCRLEVVPTSSTIDVMHQVRFAKALANGLRSAGALAVIAADFEELLDS